MVVSRMSRGTSRLYLFFFLNIFQSRLPSGWSRALRLKGFPRRVFRLCLPRRYVASEFGSLIEFDHEAFFLLLG